VVSTVPAVQQNVQAMFWYAKFETVICVQHEYDVRPLDDKSIWGLCEQFRKTGNVGRRHSAG
jgi:hypothetical protein